MSELSMDDASDDPFTRNPINGHETLMRFMVKVVVDPIRLEVFEHIDSID
jgi:hypothetical protein